MEYVKKQLQHVTNRAGHVEERNRTRLKASIWRREENECFYIFDKILFRMLEKLYLIMLSSKLDQKQYVASFPWQITKINLHQICSLRKPSQPLGAPRNAWSSQWLRRVRETKRLFS